MVIAIKVVKRPSVNIFPERRAYATSVYKTLNVYLHTYMSENIH